jgi:ectoine hydroxylase-related dioxygenase (phytanoyl-CoA dioxygenase family)
MPKVLTPEQVRFFRSEGYLFPFRSMTAEEADACLHDIEAYERQAGAEAQKLLKFKVHLLFLRIFNAVTSPAVLDVVEDLLGPNILMLAGAFFVKDPRDHRFVSWHDDSAYFGLEPVEAVTAWTGLSDSTEEMGCLQVIPRSHLEPDEQHRHTETFDSKNLLSRGQALKDVDESTAVNIVTRAGEFEVHHFRLVHGSKDNRSDRRRVGCNTVFIPTHVKSPLGRRSAMLVRGVDEYGYWDAEPRPRFDLDPQALEVMNTSWQQYLSLAKNQSG